MNRLQNLASRFFLICWLSFQWPRSLHDTECQLISPAESIPVNSPLKHFVSRRRYARRSSSFAPSAALARNLAGKPYSVNSFPSRNGTFLVLSGAFSDLHCRAFGALLSPNVAPGAGPQRRGYRSESPIRHRLAGIDPAFPGTRPLRTEYSGESGTPQ
jgi:hypothetical protein